MTQSEDERIAESVRRHGWHAITVEGTPEVPPFLYTVGLGATFRHPDLVVSGLDRPSAAHGLVSDMVARIRGGHPYRDGDRDRLLVPGYTTALVRVHPTQRMVRMGYATAFYRKAGTPDVFTALQLLWPDAGDHLPGDPGCDPEVARLQPRLDQPVPPEELRAFMARFGTAPS